MQRRRAHLAGRWYPAEERACRAALQSHAAVASTGQGDFRGILSPHAGWRFSGDAAASAFATLAEAHGDAHLVVVFGNHLGPRSPHTVFHEDTWETPVGDLAVDQEFLQRLDLDGLRWREEPLEPVHPDNGSELQMPFVRHFFPRARLAMLGAAADDSALLLGERVARAARELGRDAVFVGSTDLTHYGPGFSFEPAGPAAVDWVLEHNDRRFINRVLDGDARGLIEEAQAHRNACCPGAVSAAMSAVRSYRDAPLDPVLLSHYCSACVHDDPTFVSYAGMAF